MKLDWKRYKSDIIKASLTHNGRKWWVMIKRERTRNPLHGYLYTVASKAKLHRSFNNEHDAMNEAITRKLEFINS